MELILEPNINYTDPLYLYHVYTEISFIQELKYFIDYHLIFLN